MSIGRVVQLLKEARDDLAGEDPAWRSDLIDRAYHEVSDLWTGESHTINELLKRLRPDLAKDQSDPDNVMAYKLSYIASTLDVLRRNNTSRNDRLASLEALIIYVDKLR
jgi:hypothetical protein